MTLIEMMAAILILGVLLAAFAQAMQGSLRSIAKSAREARATSLQTEHVEGLLGLEWDSLELYESEVNAAPASYAARLDTGGCETSGVTCFDEDGDGNGDHPLVLNSDAPPLDRDTSPLPLAFDDSTDLERENVQYEIETYIMLVSRDGDADLETKRMVVFVSWPDASGNEERTIRLEAEQSPPGEALGFPPEEDTGASIPGEECFPQNDDGTCHADAPDINAITVRNKSGSLTSSFCVNASDTLSEDRKIRVEVEGLPDGSGDMYARYEFWSDTNTSSDPDQTVTLIASYVSGDTSQAFYDLTIKKGTGIFRDPHLITVDAQASNEVNDSRSDRESIDVNVQVC